GRPLLPERAAAGRHRRGPAHPGGPRRPLSRTAPVRTEPGRTAAGRPRRESGAGGGPPFLGERSVDAQAVAVEHLGDGLEERRPAPDAVAAAAGGQAERGGPGEQGAAAVARLGAHGGADQAGDAALGVVDRLVEGGDAAAVVAGGAAAAVHGLPDRGVARAGDVAGAAAVEADG